MCIPLACKWLKLAKSANPPMEHAPMRVHRFILAVLFALVWVVSTNSCLLASALAPEEDPCCEQTERGESTRQPCGANDCAPCVTLESGIHPGALIPIALPPLTWTEDALLSELLQRRMELTLEVQRLPEHSPPEPLPPPVWREVVENALPVRGPSCVL